MKNCSKIWIALVMLSLLAAVCFGAVRSAETRDERGPNKAVGAVELKNEIKIPAVVADVQVEVE